MARSITDQTSYLRTSSVVDVSSAGTIAFWLRPNWAGNDSNTHVMFYIDAAGGKSLSMQKFLDNNIYAGWHDGSDVRIVVPVQLLFSNGTWHFWTLTWDDSSNTQILNRGISLIGGQSNPFSGGSFSELTLLNYSSGVGATVNPNAAMAEFAMWNRVLSNEEIRELAMGYSPLAKPRGLVTYYPLIGGYSPETSLTGGGSLTITGTANAFAHPRSIRPHARFVGMEAAAGGGDAKPWLYRPHTHTLGAGFLRGAL